MTPEFFFPRPTAGRTDPLVTAQDTPARPHPNEAGERHVRPENLRHAECGSLRVRLSCPPATWFDALAGLGETIQLSLNPVVVLGVAGAVPTLVDWRNPLLPRDAQGSFAPNLAEHSSLWALRQLTSMGLVYGLEARDVSGAVFHRVVLGQRERRAAFEEFVVACQAPAESLESWFPPNHAWSAHRRKSIDGRVPWLRQKLADGSNDLRELPTESTPALFDGLRRAGMPLRTTFYSSPLIQSVVWTPARPDPTDLPEDRPSYFLDGGGVSLEINRAGLASAWLWMGRCSCCDEEKWAVEFADEHDRVCLALLAGNDELEPAWRNFLLNNLS